MILKELKIKTNFAELTNCYIIFDEKTKETMVIDPAGEVDRIVEMLQILGAKLKYIYLTHCHADHIAGVAELKERSGGKILIHRFDSEGLNNPDINLADYIGIKPIELDVDSRVDDEDTLHIGELEFEVILTSGHTIGSTSLYNDEQKLLFSGDTIFRGTWGRTDLPTSSFVSIMDSITNKLMKLPPETIVYPGHGKSTKIEEERPIYLELKPKKY